MRPHALASVRHFARNNNVGLTTIHLNNNYFPRSTLESLNGVWRRCLAAEWQQFEISIPNIPTQLMTNLSKRRIQDFSPPGLFAPVSEKNPQKNEKSKERNYYYYYKSKDFSDASQKVAGALYKVTVCAVQVALTVKKVGKSCQSLERQLKQMSEDLWRRPQTVWQIRRCCAMHTMVRQNTQPKLDSLRDTQPVEIP